MNQINITLQMSSNEWTTVKSTTGIKSTSGPKRPSNPVPPQQPTETVDPWDEVTVLRKNTPLKSTDPKNKVVSTTRITPANSQKPPQLNARALDEETSSQPIEKVSLSIGQLVAKERIARKMTQRDLALKTNGKVTFADVQLIESGKAFKDNNKIVDIERALNVHLRGNHQGEPLFKTQPKTS
jgi:ribosome-binding protein aMBF1 (putative translation factor)